LIKQALEYTGAGATRFQTTFCPRDRCLQHWNWGSFDAEQPPSSLHEKSFEP
jgi:hypothetical protein